MDFPVVVWSSVVNHPVLIVIDNLYPSNHIRRLRESLALCMQLIPAVVFQIPSVTYP